MTTCKLKLDKAIAFAKKRLIDKANTEGICENFGQDEVRKLRDIYIDITDYSPKMNDIRSQIDAFDNWCMTYTPNVA